jgi:hypothetical protein
MPRSEFRGRVDIGPTDVACHVLSDGRRVVACSDLVQALGGHGASASSGRRLARVPTVPEGLLTDRVIRFRVAGDTEFAEGYDVGLLIELAELVLVARTAGVLKKKQLPLATSAEAIVRHCAAVGVVQLVDNATGYDKVKTRQLLQLRIQSLIADEVEEWVSIVPAEFWAQLARIEGVRVVPDRPPIRWASYVLAFVYDAVEPDVGRELRRDGDGPRFSPDLHAWLRATGAKRLASRMRQTVVMMNSCTDLTEFQSTFAKVLHKGPLQLQLLDDPR